MRSRSRVFFLALVTAVASGLLAPARPARASASVSVSFFYDSLAPYGDWVSVPRYGRCWRPAHVSAGWQPYLYGEWDYTDFGWTWVSFDPWGGDPYHYGTWVYTDADGWVWIPGTVWAPAWVTWCITDDAYGWAPVPPNFVVGTGGYFGPAVTVSRRAYVFVPARQFADVRVNDVRLPADRNAAFVARSRPTTRFAVRSGALTAGGPALARVEHASGRNVPHVSLTQARTRAVPLRSSLQGRGSRATVVVPMHERARLVAPRERHASTNVSRTGPEVPRGGHAVRVERRPAPHERPAHVGHPATHGPEVGKSEQAVRVAPRPHPVERHEAIAHSGPPAAHAHPRPETSGALVRSEPRRVVGSPATPHRVAPVAHVQRPPHVEHAPRVEQSPHVSRPPNARPNPQGPPQAAATGRAHGGEQHKQHDKEQ